NLWGRPARRPCREPGAYALGDPIDKALASRSEYRLPVSGLPDIAIIVNRSTVRDDTAADSARRVDSGHAHARVATGESRPRGGRAHIETTADSALTTETHALTVHPPSRPGRDHESREWESSPAGQRRWRQRRNCYVESANLSPQT